MRNLRFAIFDLRLNALDRQVGDVARYSIANRKSQIANAFTLTEILVVIILIVLLVALAAPALNWMTGANSVDQAQNTVSAMLGRARNEAIGLQESVGVFFYQDPTQENRVRLVFVKYDTSVGALTYQLKVIPDKDSAALQSGVGIGLLNDRATPPVPPPTRYTGTSAMNIPATATGVIMFNGSGQLLISQYLVPVDMLGENIPAAVIGPYRTQFGFGLYEKNPLDDAIASSFSTVLDSDADSDSDADDWIDQNAIPIMVNRYNGTLIRGE